MTRPVVFNNVELDRFWNFVHERHSVYHRRFILRLPREQWTDDPVLQRFKFTNIYRELDPGTIYAVDEILSRDDSRREDRVFNLMLYRLMCSIPTYEGFGFRSLDEWTEKDFDDYLCDRYNAGGPVFGNAYLVSPYSSMGSTFKFRNVARLFGHIHQGFAEFFQRLDTAPTMEKAWKVISGLYGFGPFLAYQVLVDLTYPLPRTKYRSAIIPLDQNEWARLGPGALRGYARVAPYDYSPQSLHGLRWLHQNQRSEFKRLGLDFPFRLSPSGEVELSLPNLQNAFCEFHKFRSIQDGTGKTQRLFVPSTKGETKS